MGFLEVSDYAEKQFYRLTGVKRSVFEQMVAVVGRNLCGQKPERVWASAQIERGGHGADDA